MGSNGNSSDAYRVLFERLSTGAARFGLIRVDDRVIGVTPVDANAAFGPHHHLVPGLLEAFAAATEAGTPVTHVVGAVQVAIHPIGHDEVLVMIEDAARADLEQRTRVSQTRFETAFHGNAAAMVIATRDDLRILDVNPQWLQMFGATREEVIGRTSTELGLISREDARTRVAQHREFSEGYDVELVLMTRRGQRITVLASARPIEIPEGACTLTTLIDITGRKLAEEAFAVAFNASPAGMLLSHVGTDRIVSVNNRYTEMTGYTREHIVGRRGDELEIIRRPSRVELLQEIARAGRLTAVEVDLARIDGTTAPTILSTELVTLNENIHRLSVFTDISARKLVERRLLTQHEIGRVLAAATEIDSAVPAILEALCRSERWDCGAMWLPGDENGLQCRGVWYEPALASLATSTLSRFTQSIVPIDNGGILSRVLLSGETEQIALETPASALGTVAVAAGMHCFLVFPILRGNEVLGVVALAARTAPAKLEASERSLFDSLGRMLGLFVQRARAETSLRQLNAELERRVFARTHELATTNRDLEAFSSTVSHDLRAPLRAIQGYSRILLEDYAAVLPADAAELLGRIEASGARMRELIVNLLAYARLGRDELDRVPVDLDAMVRSVADELLSTRALGDRLSLTIHPLGTASADVALLRAVWTNLIDNALKYSRDRERIVIEIGAEQRAQETVYYVRDNGVGFDMAYAGRLFGMFERLHPVNEFEGTGVGLANVRRIVERHHGRITATSEVGVGTRFEFTLGS